ncbi:cellulose biosynthesis protein BcsN [Hoeflea sp. AS16]|uniref:cellulose biosynthesis protein BcsN n=1 Tax=Hoeflea sp. AS16 TaxID=3135779 RepID=UPI003175DA9F
MMSRFMAIMVVILSASGCTTGVDTSLSTGSLKPQAPTLIADVAPEYAAAYLPQAAGGIEAVRQSSKPDQVFQTVLYPNPGYAAGENSLSVSIAPPSSGRSYYQAPTRREIVGEMRTALPDVAMAIAAAPGQNQQGAFGYAIGRSAGGDACIFAWQIVEDISRSGQTGWSKLARSRYAAKIRLRYCHPEMSEAGLVSLVSGLRLREVSATTIEMLRFAEGSGVSSRQGYASSPVEERPAAKPVTVVARSVKKPVVAKGESRTTNASRVLMPGELQAVTEAQPGKSAAVSRTQTSAVTKTRSAVVPLPGDL